MALYPSLAGRLQSQHEAINFIIAKSDIVRITRSPAPGKWSIHENIAHLAKYQPIFRERIESILLNDSPVFDRYTADQDPDFEAWKKPGTAELLHTLKTDRQNLFNLINSQDERQLNRIGIHKKFGALTITEWAEFFVLHEAHHIFTIFQLAKD